MDPRLPSPPRWLPRHFPLRHGRHLDRRAACLPLVHPHLHAAAHHFRRLRPRSILGRPHPRYLRQQRRPRREANPPRQNPRLFPRRNHHQLFSTNPHPHSLRQLQSPRPPPLRRIPDARLPPLFPPRLHLPRPQGHHRIRRALLRPRLRPENLRLDPGQLSGATPPHALPRRRALARLPVRNPPPHPPPQRTNPAPPHLRPPTPGSAPINSIAASLPQFNEG